MVCRTQNFHNFVKVALTKQPKRRPTSDKLLEVSGNTRSVTERQNRNSLLLQHIQSLQWPSVLRHCWLGGRKSIRPEKTEWWGVGMVICLEQGADLHMAQLMLLPLTVSCFSKIQIGVTFLVPAHLGSPGKIAVKRVCVCALIFGCELASFHH